LQEAPKVVEQQQRSKIQVQQQHQVAATHRRQTRCHLDAGIVLLVRRQGDPQWVRDGEQSVFRHDADEVL